MQTSQRKQYKTSKIQTSFKRGKQEDGWNGR